MATKKEKSRADLAYEVQKFLKRLSIDFKFLDSANIFVNDSKILLGSRINNYFTFTSEIISEVPEILANYLTAGSSDQYFLNFNSTNFQGLKKALKKEVTEFSVIDNFTINFIDKETNPQEFKIYKTSSLFKLPFEVTGEAHTIFSPEGYKVEFLDSEKRKILEVPKSSLPGYTDGDLYFTYTLDPENDSFINCKLSYETSAGKNSLYFKAVR